MARRLVQAIDRLDQEKIVLFRRNAFQTSNAFIWKNQEPKIFEIQEFLTCNAMCGISGVISLNRRNVDVAVLEKATNVMRYRGPDDEGYVLIGESATEYGGKDSRVKLPRMRDEKNASVGLGHRRLSIIDVSPNGHQPLCNEDRTVWVVYNGEVYNYRELRKSLDSHTFKSDTDTEVLLHGYEEWGIEDLLKRMVGMWAFVIVDMNRSTMYLVRDRFGIKPLYYNKNDGALVFASEIKAVRVLQPSDKLNEGRIIDYLSSAYYDSEQTFFEDVKQVKPAHYLKIDLEKKALEEVEYWKIGDICNGYGKVNVGPVSSKFREYFVESIKLHLRSDVPVGTCLSGGLDSSSIVCTAQMLLDENAVKEKGLGPRIRTFSSIPREKEVSEEEYIEEVNRQEKTEAYAVTPTLDEFIADLDALVETHDEPFVGPSTYMQYRVMKLAKEKGVKVLLDGQGADESLGGYYSYLAYYFKDLKRQGSYLKLLKEAFHFRGQLSPFVGKVLRRKLGLWEKTVEGLVKVSPISSSIDKYLDTGSKTFAEQLKEDVVGRNLLELLKYEDRNSMNFSIESRVPFLYHPMIEYIFSLPMSAKISNGWTKLILREAMKSILPEKIRKRKSKLGFPAPIESWALELICRNKQELKNSIQSIEKYIDPEIFEKLMDNITRHRYDEDIKLFWRILIFERWHQRIMKNSRFAGLRMTAH
jgi:asparagine synthase (glutamine-hydrolysing)